MAATTRHVGFLSWQPCVKRAAKIWLRSIPHDVDTSSSQTLCSLATAAEEDVMRTHNFIPGPSSRPESRTSWRNLSKAEIIASSRVPACVSRFMSGYKGHSGLYFPSDRDRFLRSEREMLVGGGDQVLTASHRSALLSSSRLLRMQTLGSFCRCPKASRPPLRKPGSSCHTVCTYRVVTTQQRCARTFTCASRPQVCSTCLV